MELAETFVEYYDELYPIIPGQKELFTNLMKEFPEPARLLRVGCGTGLFEHLLARENADVTGIEDTSALLRSANLRRRTQLMSLRFFQMSYLDMARFLGKGFYSIISCLDDRILFIHDLTLIKKFFFDTKQLLTNGGYLIITLPNFKLFGNEKEFSLPDRKSIRSSLFTYIDRENGSSYLSQDLETGNGKIFTIHEHEKIHELTAEEIETFAKEAGFSQVNLYSDFNKNPFSPESEKIVALLKA